METLRDLLFNNCHKYSNNILFETNNIKISYQQFLQDVFTLAKRNFNRFANNNILLIGTTSYEWAVAYFSIVISGGVAVILEPKLNEKEVKLLCSQYEIKTVVSSLPTLNLEANDILIINFKDIETNTENNFYPSFMDISEDKVCTIAFTSGTTDASKGVMLSNKNLCSNVYAGCSVYEYKSNDVILNVLPFHHLFGLTYVLIASIINGNKIVFSSIDSFFEDLKQVDPSFLILVPEMTKFLLLRIKKFGLIEAVGNRLNKILCGGAQIDEAVIRDYRKYGIDLSSCYGITECSPGIAVMPMGMQRNDTGEIVLPCNEVRISEETHEILVKGSNVMVGYYGNPKLTNEVIVDGWFHTGDIGFLKDGFLFISGRIKNLMVFDNGKKVSPEEIEKEFLQYSIVDDVLVYKKNNQIHTKIFSISFKENREILKDIHNIIEKINSKLPIYKHISSFEMMDLPFEKTCTNKIKRGKYNNDT